MTMTGHIALKGYVRIGNRGNSTCTYSSLITVGTRVTLFHFSRDVQIVELDVLPADSRLTPRRAWHIHKYAQQTPRPCSSSTTSERKKTLFVCTEGSLQTLGLKSHVLTLLTREIPPLSVCPCHHHVSSTCS